ncbi:hypothetical protein [Spirulina sp. 06S082]|uniref:hypothetical protein n=1 Tax=Spirulina sp. 06S082 TaxID=3110248 RepID=UPI002B1F55DE|nr:hypothetical protein [Spirulina sp. 06S082]MEA5472144.1 hypothetical protein [Spirulina sp. 06S082]
MNTQLENEVEQLRIYRDELVAEIDQLHQDVFVARSQSTSSHEILNLFVNAIDLARHLMFQLTDNDPLADSVVELLGSTNAELLKIQTSCSAIWASHLLTYEQNLQVRKEFDDHAEYLESLESE